MMLSRTFPLGVREDWGFPAQTSGVWVSPPELDAVTPLAPPGTDRSYPRRQTPAKEINRTSFFREQEIACCNRNKWTKRPALTRLKKMNRIQSVTINNKFSQGLEFSTRIYTADAIGSRRGRKEQETSRSMDGRGGGKSLMLGLE